MKLNALTSALLVSTLGFSAAASANIVDMFDDPAGNGVHTVTDTSIDGNAVFMEYGPSASILGGYRDLIVELVGSNGIGVANANAEVGGGGFSFSSSSGDTGIGRIQWDGADASADLNIGGLNHEDLVHQAGCPVAGCNAFVAEILVADQGFQYQIGVYTDASNYTILTSDTLFPVGSTYLSTYDFDWFALATGDYFLDGLPFHIDSFGTGADVTDVGAIEVVINSDGGTVAVDLAIDLVEKRRVPEPGTLALLGIGLLGASLVARRK